jgi:hypothetical protein
MQHYNGCALEANAWFMDRKTKTDLEIAQFNDEYALSTIAWLLRFNGASGSISFIIF